MWKTQQDANYSTWFVVNNCLFGSNLSWLHEVLFTKHHVFTHHSRMVLPKERIVISKQPLLLHHNVPLRFWVLIHHMSYSVLQDQVPYSLLYLQLDLYPMSLRVFGKLAAKSLKCIFLSYSRLQKICRYFSPELQWYIVYPKVTFFETSLFFSSSVTFDINLTDILCKYLSTCELIQK